MTAGRARKLVTRRFARVIARRRWVVVAPIVTALVAALGLAALQDPVYEARTEMLVDARRAGSVFDASGSEGDPARLLANEIQLLESEQVRKRVASDLGLSTEAPEVSGDAIGSTDVVAVEVRSGDPSTARVLADAYAQAYNAITRERAVAALTAAGDEVQRKVIELQGQIDALDQRIASAPANQQADLAAQRRVLLEQQSAFEQRLDQLEVDAALATGNAEVVRAAEQPDDPVEPRPVRSALLALVGGLVIGLLAAFLLDSADDSVRSPGDLEQASGGLPVLAVVPTAAAKDHRPIALSRPTDTVVEAYRGLRTTLQFLSMDRSTRVVQITSALPGDGKTTVASNLAVVFAQAGLRTLVIDAELRRPSIHKVFAVNPARGLTDALLGAEVTKLVHHIRPNLDVLPAGSAPPNPSELLGSPRMRELLDALSGSYDMIVLDSAPVLPVADAVALATAAAGVVVVTHAAKSSDEELRTVVARLRHVQAPILGTVLNRSSSGLASLRYADGYDDDDRSSPPLGLPEAKTPKQRRERSDRDQVSESQPRTSPPAPSRPPLALPPPGPAANAPTPPFTPRPPAPFAGFGAPIDASGTDITPPHGTPKIGDPFDDLDFFDDFRRDPGSR